MDQEDINELHGLIQNYAIEKGYETKHLLAFLTSVFIGTMEMKGYSQEFMDATCDRMKVKFREKRKENGA